MANVCNKDQSINLPTGQQSFKKIEAMLTDLALFTSNTCNGNFQEEGVDRPRKPTDYRSLQRIVSDMEISMSADRAYDRLMGSDYECSYIFVPQCAPKMLETRSSQQPIQSTGQQLSLQDDQSSVTTGRSSAPEHTESESEARTPIVKEKKKKERKNEQRRDSDRPSAVPSYMTVIDNNQDEVSKASSVIDAGFDAKISVKRAQQEMCKLDLSADVANGTIRCLRINRKTFRI